VCDALGVGLCLADQRRQARAQIGGRCRVEAVIDLSGIDQVRAFAAGEIEAVSFAAVEGEACDH
jgi:hypothetical protein